MTLLDKYLAGQTEAAYNEIYSLGPKAFDSDNFEQIDEVLNETFKRVQFNLKTIHNKLRVIGYQFLADRYEESERPFVLADNHSKDLIKELDSIAEPNYLPLSLKYFYKHIGTCDFTWDWEKTPDIPWEGADPIVIPTIKYIMDGIDSYSSEFALCPDDLHKDNVSGNSYYLELSETRIIDSIISGYNMNFIEYLRLTFLNCGFTSAEKCNAPSLREFCQEVRPNLLSI